MENPYLEKIKNEELSAKIKVDIAIKELEKARYYYENIQGLRFDFERIADKKKEPQ